MWTCPRCDRRFGAVNRPHVCAPATRAGYVVPLMSPGDVDDELAAWIVRSFEDAAPRRR
jgi:hypothetical protein